MNTTIKQLERMPIEEFAEIHDLTMYVVERYHSTAGSYFLAAFKDHVLHLYRDGVTYPDTCIGQGSTPEQAIQDYAKRISNKFLYSKLTAQALARCPIFIPKDHV